jgi:hypothetical protein
MVVAVGKTEGAAPIKGAAQQAVRRAMNIPERTTIALSSK